MISTAVVPVVLGLHSAGRSGSARSLLVVGDDAGEVCVRV